MNMSVQELDETGSKKVQSILEMERTSIVSRISDFIPVMNKTNEMDFLYLETFMNDFKSVQKELRGVKRFQKIMKETLGHE